MSAGENSPPPGGTKGTVATHPPCGSGLTELRVMPSGATTQPIQVSPGIACAAPAPCARASISKISTDSRNPWCTTYRWCRPSSTVIRFNPWALNRSFSLGSIGPGQSG